MVLWVYHGLRSALIPIKDFSYVDIAGPPSDMLGFNSICRQGHMCFLVVMPRSRWAPCNVSVMPCNVIVMPRRLSGFDLNVSLAPR
jgi:hypothetical protein